MLVGGTPRRTIWSEPDAKSVGIIDQTRLPHEWKTREIRTLAEMAEAIKTMQVRGAPLIGVAGAFGLALALRADSTDAGLESASKTLIATRPTAVNLRWAVDRVAGEIRRLPPNERASAAYELSRRMAEEDVDVCRKIAGHGYELLKAAWKTRRQPERLNILTHCNAGWLATVDWGTALAPVFLAQREGMAVHVWVDETRPRSQGALTAWELANEGIAHTYIADNAGGHLMQHGQVDVCIVGTDRTTANGDVCNKIGTYLKALAAKANGVPFYVGAPSSSIDFSIRDGVANIPIEERDQREVHNVSGLSEGKVMTVRVTPEGSAAANPAFDVTPANLVTALITERGVSAATTEGLAALFPDRVASAK